MNRRITLPIGAIILFVISASIYFGIPDEVDSGSVRYDYDVEIVDSFESKSGYVYTADIGTQFVIVTWTVANDSFEDGFSTDDLIFQADVVAGGLSYTPRVIGFDHPGYVSATIVMGHTASFVYVYQIPEGFAVEDIGMEFEYMTVYPPEMIRDEGLRSSESSCTVTIQ